MPNLLTEASTAEEVAAAYDLVNQALIRKAVTQAKTQALEEATSKLLKGQMSAMKEMAESQAIIDEQRAKGFGKVSQGARDNIKRQQETIKFLKEEYQESLKTIDEASKDLEKTLGLNAENSGKRQVKSVKKTQKELKDIYAKAQKERDDFNKMLLKEELEQRQNQREQYSYEEKAFLDDLNDEYERYLEEKRLADERALETRIVTGKQIGRASCRERVSSPV